MTDDIGKWIVECEGYKNYRLRLVHDGPAPDCYSRSYRSAKRAERAANRRNSRRERAKTRDLAAIEEFKRKATP